MKKLLNKLKERSLINNRKKILKNYYSKELRKGKTYRASFMDKILLYGICFLILSLILTIKSNEFLLSIFISGLSIYFFLVVTSFYFRKSKAKKISEINEGLKKRKLIREFSNLNKEGFTNYVKVIFEEYYDTEIKDAELPLDLKFTKDGDLFGVKCIKASMEDRIGSRELGILIQKRSLNSMFCPWFSTSYLLLFPFPCIIK